MNVILWAHFPQRVTKFPASVSANLACSESDVTHVKQGFMDFQTMDVTVRAPLDVLYFKSVFKRLSFRL